MSTRPERPSRETIQEALNKARILVPIHTLWAHRNGETYLVLGHTVDVFDGIVQVLYRNVTDRDYDAIQWTRKLSVWLETVEGAPRFTLQETLKN